MLQINSYKQKLHKHVHRRLLIKTVGYVLIHLFIHSLSGIGVNGRSGNVLTAPVGLSGGSIKRTQRKER